MAAVHLFPNHLAGVVGSQPAGCGLARELIKVPVSHASVYKLREAHQVRAVFKVLAKEVSQVDAANVDQGSVPKQGPE